MSEDTQEDIIEDVTEEAILEDQELEQDTSAEEIAETQEQDLSDTIMSVLLGETKAKKEAEHDDDEDEEEEVEESTEVSEDDAVAEAKKVSEEEDEEEEDEEEEVKEAKSKKESEHDDDDDKDEVEEEEDEEEEDMDEATAPTGGDAKQAKVIDDEDAVAKADAAGLAKSVKPAAQPKGKTAKGAQTTDNEEESIKDADKAANTKLAKEDLDILISSEANLTEEFKSKASTLFEAAVADKVIAEKKRLQEEFDTNLQEEVSQVRDTLVERIDDYLGYVVETWIEDNQVAVDTKLRTDIAEGFMDSLKTLFTESYIEVPESKVDLFDELSEEVDTVKESLEASEKEKAELAEQVEKLTRSKVISEASSDLAATQASKLSELTTEIEYVSEEVFTEKVKTIKESLFNSTAKEEESSDVVEGSTETVIEGVTDPSADLPKSMQAYLKALSNK